MKINLNTKEGRAEYARRWRANNRDHDREVKRKRLGTGETADEDKILFYGYKEPLRKFDKGFGYQGVLRYSKDKEKVECHFCGKLFRALNNGHLGKVHGMTASEYKEKTGLSQQASLVGEVTREKLFNRPVNPNHMEELKKAQAKRKERKLKGLKDLQSGFKLSLEHYNKRGTCPDQLLDIIDRTVKSFGKVPTEEQFLKFHGGKYMGSIRRTYGTWTNALAKLKLRPHMVMKTRESLIEEMKLFYKVNKRTPRYSDMQRGLLSSASCFYRNFRNLNHARLLADIPLVMTGFRRGNTEYKPDKAERERMLRSY